MRPLYKDRVYRRAVEFKDLGVFRWSIFGPKNDGIVGRSARKEGQILIYD
jgi:hypothetical protein